jgi:hypothetical protein
MKTLATTKRVPVVSILLAVAVQPSRFKQAVFESGQFWLYERIHAKVIDDVH